MNDATDNYLRQRIKNWAAQQKPPPNGRSRLLLVASSTANKLMRLGDTFEGRSHFAPNRSSSQHIPSWLFEPLNRSALWSLDIDIAPLPLRNKV